MIKERKDNDFLIQKLKNIKVENGNTKNEVMIAKQKIKDLQKKEKNIKIEDKKDSALSLYNKNQTDIDIKTDTEVKKQLENTVKTKDYFVCPVCGNDMFYKGACGGLSQNILCDNCYSEINYTPCGCQLHSPDSVDLGRLLFYTGSKKKAKQNKEAYNKVMEYTPLWQKILYLFHR